MSHALLRMIERQLSLCFYCGTEFDPSIKGRQPTIEHRHPRCRGGRNNAANRRATCYRCNSLKGPLTEEEFWDCYAEAWRLAEEWGANGKTFQGGRKTRGAIRDQQDSLLSYLCKAKTRNILRDLRAGPKPLPPTPPRTPRMSDAWSPTLRDIAFQRPPA